MQSGQVPDPGLALLAFFVDGLGVGDEAFANRCAECLLANGPKAIPRLMQAIGNPKTKPRAKTKLLEIIEQLQSMPEGSTADNAGTLAVIALVDGLRVRQVSVHRRVREIFCRFPDGELGNRLVREAVSQMRKPAYCVRLLETAALVAHQQEPEHFLRLSLLFAQGSLPVKTAVLRLLELVRQAAEQPVLA